VRIAILTHNWYNVLEVAQVRVVVNTHTHTPSHLNINKYTLPAFKVHLVHDFMDYVCGSLAASASAQRRGTEFYDRTYSLCDPQKQRRRSASKRA
jgi:carbonic anhydrase